MLPVPQPDIFTMQGQVYLEFHSSRYAYLLNRVDWLLDRRFENAWKILDIGPSFQTAMLRSKYQNAVIDTAGFQDHRFPARQQDCHFELNLNEPPLLALGEYDIVILAEVLEHLYSPPVRVLRTVQSWLKPGGAVIIQTPNPISLGKRLQLLVGRSPFEVIREDLRNPGHFCEYTVTDLAEIAANAGYEVLGIWVKNYFGSKGTWKIAYDLACVILPGHLQDGITAVLRKPFPKL